MKKRDDWYSILRFYRNNYRLLLNNIALLQKIGKQNIQEKKSIIQVTCFDVEAHNLLIRNIGEPICQRVNGRNLEDDLTVVWPLKCYQAFLPRKEERNLKRRGVRISFAKDGVHFLFPNFEVLSDFRQENLRVTS